LSNFRTIKNNISESFIQTLPSLKPYANRQELEIAMADARIPNSMIPKLQQAWEEGGSLAKIKEDDILGILKSKGLEPKDYVGIVDNVRRNFPSDRSINETSLTEAVDKQLQLGHTSTGSGWVNYFFGDDELTRFEAEKAGRLAGFLPTLEDGDGNRTPQAKQAELIIRDLIANDPKFSGIKITPRMIQLYMLEADFGEAPGATLNEVREALPEAFRRR